MCSLSPTSARATAIKVITRISPSAATYTSGWGGGAQIFDDFLSFSAERLKHLLPFSFASISPLTKRI